MAEHDTLSSAEVDALHEAIDDEYKSVATYEQVLADFGEIRPFSNIVEAERRHIGALSEIFDTFAIPLPANTWAERAPRYTSIDEACRSAVDGEIENGEMYERLLAATAHPRVTRVFENLQRASQQNHLEAFRRCVDRPQSGSQPRDDSTDHPAGSRRRRRHRGGRPSEETS